MSGELSIQNVVKSYGEKNVLNGISFDAKRGEFIVLVGPSGCGKSTMLRSIAGLETVTSGAIKIDDKDVTEFAPKDRHIAMVFQDYALYPHKSVYENIAFGLRIRKQSESDIDAKVKIAAEKLNLMPYLDRKPGALSGGQRQRVAIGRAIVREPKIFLFDEPLSNLDAKLRGDMRVTIAKLHKDLNATIVYVTHDQVEAMTLADKIIVLDGGHIQQMGTPLNLYYHPSNVFVATFIGSPPMNLVSGSIVVDGDIKVDCGDGLVYTLPEDFQAQVKPRVKSGQKVLWGLRPENFRVEDAKSTGPVYDAIVEVTEPLGPTTSVHCRVGKHSINVMLSAPFRPGWGEKLRLELKSKHLYLFDEESQVSLVD